MDSIGLGGFLANIVVIAGLGISFVVFVWMRKNNKPISLIWLSCSLNVVSFFYFMGTVSYYLSIFNIVVWPLVNAFLVAYNLLYKKDKRNARR